MSNAQLGLNPNDVRLVFASHNNHKADEIRAALPESISIVTLSELEYFQEIPETGNTLFENALIKAKKVFELFQLPCFADDTGLLVEALQGKPGVYSARYAGENASASDNISLLLANMQPHANKKAMFQTVFCYIDRNKIEHFFSGELKGEIVSTLAGSFGFGYDPVFKPEGIDKTCAELTQTEKNSISHRSLALSKLIDFIKKQN